MAWTPSKVMTLFTHNPSCATSNACITVGTRTVSRTSVLFKCCIAKVYLLWIAGRSWPCQYFIVLNGMKGCAHRKTCIRSVDERVMCHIEVVTVLSWRLFMHSAKQERLTSPASIFELPISLQACSSQDHVSQVPDTFKYNSRYAGNHFAVKFIALSAADGAIFILHVTLFTARSVFHVPW